MPVTRDEIRMGDTVRLRNGELIQVFGTCDRWGDRHGEYEGPWVTAAGTHDHFLVADVLEVAVRNPRSCKFCGDGVTATNPKTEFCRNCFYTGVAFNDLYADVIDKFREAFPDHWVGVEHTGGGCFWLAVRSRDESNPIYWCATAGEASLPVFEEGELWGIVCRYCDDEDKARHVKVNGADYWEYEGVPILCAPVIEDDIPQPMMGHDEVIDAIRKDMARVR
jgi:hypothetical protein